MIRKLVTVSDLFRVILPNKEDLSLERERVFTIWFKEKSVFVCVCAVQCVCGCPTALNQVTSGGDGNHLKHTPHD